jgi:DNA-binding protein HU-beta
MALIGKEDLIQEVAERSGLGIAEARTALEEMLGAIETQLAEGNEVRLTGFGKFSVSRRKAREGRNPQTGEPIQIAAKKVPHFTAGADLKNALPAPSGTDRAANASETGRSGRKPAKEAGGPRVSRKRAAGDRATSTEREAAPDSDGADEGESGGSGTAGKTVPFSASGAKVGLVTAAGLVAGAAGGLAFIHLRK